MISFSTLFIFFSACSGGASPAHIPKDGDPFKKIREQIDLQYHYYGMNNERSLAYGENALALLQSHHNDLLTAEALNGVAKIQIIKGEMAAAEKAIRQALQCAEKSGDLNIIGDVNSTIGLLYQQLGRYREALTYLNLGASQLTKTIPKPSYLARSLNLLGLFYLDIGDSEKALDYFLQSEAVYRQIGPSLGLGYVINNIGLLNIRFRRYDAAMRNFQEAARIFEALRLDSGLITIYMNIGILLALENRNMEALVYNEKALTLASRQKEPMKEASVYSSIAQLYIQLNRFQEAEKAILKAMSFANRKDVPMLYANDLTNYSVLLQKQGRLKEAQQFLMEAIQISSRLNDLDTLESAYQTLSSVLEDSGRPREALEYYKKFLHIASRIQDVALSTRIEEQKTQQELKMMQNLTIELASKSIIQQLELEKRRSLIITTVAASLLFLFVLISLLSLLWKKQKRHAPLEQEIGNHVEDQKRLREREAMFRDLAEHSPLGIFILQDNVLKYVNPFIARLTGYSREELINQSPDGFIHPDDLAPSDEYYRQRMQNLEEEGDFEFRGFNRRGEGHFLKIRGVAIAYDGRPALLGVLTDITRQTILNLDLQRSREHESIALLTAGIAHDFNNSLAVILGYLQMCRQEEALPPETLEKTESAINSAVFMSEMINHLLALVHPGQ